MLSDATWRRYFGGKAEVLDKTVTFTGNSAFVGPIALGRVYTIIGVMPRGFHNTVERIVKSGHGIDDALRRNHRGK